MSVSFCSVLGGLYHANQVLGHPGILNILTLDMMCVQLVFSVLVIRVQVVLFFLICHLLSTQEIRKNKKQFMHYGLFHTD